MYRGPIVLPLLLVAAGVVLLLINLDVIEADVGDLVRRFWPLLLIAVGVEVIVSAALHRRSRPEAESLDLPLDGTARGEIRLLFGAGTLTVGPAPAGSLLAGTFEGGVRVGRAGAGRLELRSQGDGWWAGAWRGRAARWDVGLSTEVPLALRLETGASRAQLDLSAIQLSGLVLRIGASETDVRLPSPRGHVTVEADIGAASVSFALPPGAAARVHSTMGLGSSDVDQRRFLRQGRAHATPDFDGAADRYELDIRGGVGSVTVR